ncbi:hypothetical protein MTR_3g464660 [Medicago truncatula]|uniref:Uncharacterized protein n=1 Tax=Medicago truncatula TaxID=3880 RepID=A0A072V831_MEDTR|nr:hypothetical protein MTR_3g464660 [Medicago truncatula]
MTSNFKYKQKSRIGRDRKWIFSVMNFEIEAEFGLSSSDRWSVGEDDTIFRGSTESVCT